MADADKDAVAAEGGSENGSENAAEVAVADQAPPAEEYEALTADKFDEATEVFKKEGDDYNKVDPKPAAFENGLYVKKTGAAPAPAQVPAQDGSTGTTADAAAGELVTVLKKVENTPEPELINAFQKVLDQLKKKNPPVDGQGGGRRRTKRKGRKGSKKSKKGAKKSKKGAKKSQKGGRSRKNRRKHSHRRKH